MPQTLDPELRRALAERVRYYREIGIYDLYRRETVRSIESLSSSLQPEIREEMAAKKSAVAVSAVKNLVAIASNPEQGINDPIAALQLIREDLGECTRCQLHKGRTKLVYGVGSPRADLMFVGEGPGADEDAQENPSLGVLGNC